MTFRLVGRVRRLLFLALVGCGAPEASAELAASVTDRGLVIAALTSDEVQFHASFEQKDAPAGEYFVFTSLEPPTALPDMDAFDPDACVGACVVPGLGQVRGRQVLTEPGLLSVGGAPYDPTGNHYEETLRYFVLARRGTDLPPMQAVKVTITVEAGGGGCGELDPPELDADTL